VTTAKLPPEPSIIKPVIWAGAYWVGGPYHGIAFYLERRPNRWHRLWTRIFLGWHWRDQ
jgi:hypothetical protein